MLNLAVLAKGRSPESSAINGKLGFNALQRQGRRGYKVVQNGCKFWVHHIVAYRAEGAAIGKITSFQSHSHIAHKSPARECGIQQLDIKLGKEIAPTTDKDIMTC